MEHDFLWLGAFISTLLKLQAVNKHEKAAV